MKKIISAFILILILFNISGCIEKKVISREEQADITYRIKFLPEDILSDIDESMCYLLFDGLFIEEDGKIKNSLCSSFTVSNENKCYDFSIKKGMVFFGGETINAMDFKVYFDYLKKQGLLDNVKSIKAQDVNTLRIELIRDDKNFINHLTDPVFFLRNINDKGINIKTSYNKLHYSGPYHISNISEKYILLKKNDNYYNKKLVIADTVKIIIEPLDEMALALFDEGKIDILSCSINEKAGKKINLSYGINILFNSNEIFKTQQERDDLVYELRKKIKLSEGQEWTQKAKDAEQADINNADYNKYINIFCSDTLSLYSENISEILNDKGYKTKINEKAGDENQILVEYGMSENLQDLFPIIFKYVYLYNHDVEGYYYTGRGTLVLINAYKIAPLGS